MILQHGLPIVDVPFDSIDVITEHHRAASPEACPHPGAA
jgi:hypothetical protein